MPTRKTDNTTDAIVIGGGLGGLAAAALMGRAGLRVTLYEKATAPGGRAQSQTRNGCIFNLGPHALYRKAAGAAVLSSLGVPLAGRCPSAATGFAVAGGRKHTLPGGPLSLLTTSLLPLAAKLETARLLTAIPRLDTTALDAEPLHAWLARRVRHAAVRELVVALVRLTSYSADPARMSAGAALAQLRLALTGNVLYLDGGWQTLIDGLRDVAVAAGVRIVTGVRVAAVEHDERVRGVCLADGTIAHAGAVVVAAGPDEALALLPRGADTPLARIAADLVPVHAACLDLALTRLPDPRTTFGLGIDQPLYFSVHSAWARLAPEGTAVLHVLKYLGSHPARQAADDERELEALLDLLQPGWRALVCERRFLPRMTVAHALVTAAAGGLRGRPRPEATGIDGFYVVGDWVGGEGMIADASLASARDAAALVTRRAAAAGRDAA